MSKRRKRIPTRGLANPARVLVPSEDLPVLFTEGDWCIKGTRGEYAFAKVDSVIFHECSQPNYSHSKQTSVWLYRDELKVPCRVCGQTPPPGLQALWLFHNADCGNVDGDPWPRRNP